MVIDTANLDWLFFESEVFLMPKFLVRGSYSLDGTKGLIKAGGSARREAVKKACESVGGRLESYYFVFGPDDFVIILDAPDSASAAALSLTAGSSGGIKNTQMALLLTPEEIDQAAKKSVQYNPPGA